jgi:prevent-host-death family protein
MTMVMKEYMPAGEFKAKCLQVMDRVRNKRAEVVITKRGVPVAKIVPVEDESRAVFNCMRGTATIAGDLLEPVVAALDWEALGEPGSDQR